MLAGWLHRLVEGVGVAVVISRFASLVAIAAVVVLGIRAEALSITGLTIAKGGTNTADGSTLTGNNFMQTTSAVSTTLSPSAAADTLGSFTEFITRYAMIVAADRQNTSGSTTTSMTSSYSITFTVNNPTGAQVQIDIDTLRVGALTSVNDSAGSSTITLGAISGQLNTVTQAGLGVAAVGGTASSTAINTAFSQAGTTVTILTSAVTSNYVLQFDFSSSGVSAHDGAAIRMGLAGSLPMTADDYPGAGSRTQSNDGHFADVKATIIAVPEPESAGLLALGVLLLALRRQARTRR
jgi:hypothetical protein